MNKQRVYLNSCQLLIQSFAISTQLNEEQLYFVWKKGKKFNKSNLYEIELNETVPVQEKLEMNLKIYQTGSKLETKNTHLYVIVRNQNGYERELCQFKLGVNNWDHDLQKMQLQIKQNGRAIGLITLQAKRREIMQLQNFHKYTAEIEESSQGQASIISIQNTIKGTNTELIQIQKQLQDLKYLNEKLKKDRTLLISRNQVVENQISSIKQMIKAEMKRMQEYYEKKIETHTSIYQQEIQQLITAFNQTSDQNGIIMRAIIEENEGLAADLQELRIISEEELERQQSHYKLKIGEMEDDKEKLQDIVQQLQVKLSETQKDLIETNKKLDSLSEQFDNLTINYEIDKKDFKTKSEEYQKLLQTQRKLISDLKNQIALKTEQIHILSSSQKQLKQQLKEDKQKYENLFREKVKLQNELQQKVEQITLRIVQLKQTRQIIKSRQEEYQNYISQNQKKGIKYQEELHLIQMQSKSKQVEFDKIISEQRSKYFSEHIKFTQIQIKYEDLEKLLMVRNQQIKVYSDENTKLNDQLILEHQHLLQTENEMRQLFQQMEHFKMLSKNSEDKVQLLTDQLDLSYKKNKEDLEALRDHYEETVKTRQKYYEEQIQILRQKLQNNEVSFLKLTNDFRVEMQVNKEQMQKLQQQQIILIQEKNDLLSANRKFQFQAGQYKQLLNDAKQEMKQRQHRYEQSIKMFMVESKALKERQEEIQKSKKKIQPTNSLEQEIDFQVQVKDGFLFPGTKKGAQKSENSIMISPEQQQYLKQAQQLGSLQHIKYLRSIQQSHKQNSIIVSRLEDENSKLKLAFQQLKIANDEAEGQVFLQKEEINQLTVLVSDLQQELRYFINKQEMKKEKEGEGEGEGEDKLNLQENQQAPKSERSERQQRQEKLLKKFSDKQIQDSRQFKILTKSRSRVSKAGSGLNIEDKQVQVSIITWEKFKELQQMCNNRSQLFDEMGEVQQYVTGKNKNATIKKPPSLSQSNRLQSSQKYLKQKQAMQKKNKQLSRKIGSLQQEVRQRNQQLKSKQMRIQKLQARNRQIFDEMSSLRQQFGIKLSIQQSKLLQYSENTKRDDDIQKMKFTLSQKQQQIRNTSQNFAQLKAKLSYENDQLRQQNKKLKSSLEQLEQKLKKTFGGEFSRILQQQIQDANKKVIEYSRLQNQAKIQKEVAEDEVRLLKKRMAEQEKYLSLVGDKKNNLQQELQVTIRKYNKAKRDNQQKQQETIRLKQQCKRCQQQINSMSTLSSNIINERKRHMQQKLQFEEQLSKKDGQIRKLMKQLTKNLQKVTETDTYSNTLKLSSEKQLQKLEGQLIKHKKSNLELEDKCQNQAQRIKVLEQSQRIKGEQLRQGYRQKLSQLVNQINDIKNILNQSQEEIQRLQLQRNQLKQQLENLMNYAGKLQEIRDGLLEQKQGLEQQIQANLMQLEETKKQLVHYHQDSVQMHNNIANLQQQLNKQRMILSMKSQKLQQLENLTQKYLYEQKTLKCALMEHQTKQDIEAALLSKIGQLQKQNGQIKEQLILTSQEYQRYKGKFVHTKQQLDEIVQEMKEQFQEIRKKQLADTIDQLDHEYQTKNIKRQQQLIELYNETTKLKLEIQHRQQQNATILQKYTQIQKYPQKCKQLKQQNENLSSQNQFIKKQSQRTKAKMQKMEMETKELERVILELRHEIQRLTSVGNSEKARASRIEQDLLQTQTAYNITKQQLRKISTQLSQKSQSQSTLLQSYQQKLLSLQLENNRIKQREENMHRQYKQQLTKQQQKLKELIASLQSDTTAQERQYKNKFSEKDKLLKQANKQIGGISADIKRLESELNQVKQENDALSHQLSNTRLQMSEDQEIYITEINKLKNNIKQMEDIYNYNLNSLQQQLAQLNRQLTMQKLNNRQQNGLTSSRLRESEVERRTEQKLRAKDQKIQELKNNIFMLEETVIRLKKKGDLEQQSSLHISSVKYQTLYSQLQTQMESMKLKQAQQTTSRESIERQLRKQINKYKQNEENYKLMGEQQNLQLQSVKGQLATIKQIYQNLQRQMEKRQIKMSENINVQSRFEKQLQQKIKAISDFEERISQLQSQNQNLHSKMKSKQIQLDQTMQKLVRQTHLLQKIKHSSQDTLKLSQIHKFELQSVKQQADKLAKQNKRLIFQVEGLRQQSDKARNRANDMQKQNRRLSKQLNEAVQKIYENEDVVGKYTTVNQKSIENHGVNVQQLVLGGFLDEKFFDQEQQLNQLKQDYQQLKFNEDRRRLDYDQMKKQNFELSLKVEDYQFVSEQVETLRKICDKLEEEKKIAIFRQQAIRIRLANLIHRNQAKQNIRDGLQAILNLNHNVYA